MHNNNDRNRSGGGVDARRGDRAEKIAEESSDETADVIALRAENAALRDELHTLRLELQARYARDTREIRSRDVTMMLVTSSCRPRSTGSNSRASSARSRSDSSSSSEKGAVVVLAVYGMIMRDGCA